MLSFSKTTPMEAEIEPRIHIGLQVRCPWLVTDRNETWAVCSAHVDSWPRFKSRSTIYITILVVFSFIPHFTHPYATGELRREISKELIKFCSVGFETSSLVSCCIFARLSGSASTDHIISDFHLFVMQSFWDGSPVFWHFSITFL